MPKRIYAVTLFLIVLTGSAIEASAQSSAGPAKGTLVIQGGGDILPEIWERFVSLAGGTDANFVFIPTADDPVDPEQLYQDEFPTKRFKHVNVLHAFARLGKAAPDGS